MQVQETAVDPWFGSSEMTNGDDKQGQQQRQRQVRGFFPFDKLRVRMTPTLGCAGGLNRLRINEDWGL
jgi:hypothetical protein